MRDIQTDDLTGGLTRLLACCSFTLSGTAFEGMWGAALDDGEATQAAAPRDVSPDDRPDVTDKRP
ncbi:hypothetical protein ACP3S8_03300 [Mixta calida]|uniref:hypothetical protein n=1 Tax=Mixta calida TaxID=665913 RepID=UPI003CEAAB3E